MLRTSTEKPEGIEAGTITIGNIRWNILKDIIKSTLQESLNEKNHIFDYQTKNVSDKICKIIIGYTSIVNKSYG